MGLTPWDLKGTVVPAIKQAVEDGDITPEKYPNVLIPGCGSGYECFYFREQGFPSIKGIDLSQTAIEKANKILSEKNLDNVSFEQADFFALPETKKYDFIFDYLFFAALDHDLRSKWAGSMQRCLSRKGVLATLIFPLRTASDDPNKGPPYPVELGDYEKALVPLGFTVDKIIQVNRIEFDERFLYLLSSRM
jgi:SAM-dependent methyltransferase